MDRQGFLKKACLAGVCGCGFAALALNAYGKNGKAQVTPFVQDDQAVQGNSVGQQWLRSLLDNLNSNMEEAELRRIVKMSAGVHYEQLKMDDLLAGYAGRLEEFLDFLEKEWGWKIDYDETTGILLADENKSWCVCPVLGKTTAPGNATICYCSEGFAEMMFSKVSGSAVSVDVISSVRRGDKSCIYRVTIPV